MRKHKASVSIGVVLLIVLNAALAAALAAVVLGAGNGNEAAERSAQVGLESSVVTQESGKKPPKNQETYPNGLKGPDSGAPTLQPAGTYRYKGGVAAQAVDAERKYVPKGKNCRANPAPVDPKATQAAKCLAALIDYWKSKGFMAVGQQIMLAQENFYSPLTALGDLQPKIIGFDFTELRAVQERGIDPVPTLIEYAKKGYVLRAYAIATNPHTGGGSNDLSWKDLGAVTDESTPEAKVAWGEWAKTLKQIKRFQDAGVALIVAPWAEAGGDWTWYGNPDPQTFKKVFKMTQDKAYKAGVHNILWSFASAPWHREGIAETTSILPERIDVAGIDTYDQEYYPEEKLDKAVLWDYEKLEAVVPRMGLNEVGAHGSDGDWNPAVITDTLNAAGLYAFMALLWFDDGQVGIEPEGAYHASGYKEIASMNGGAQWLTSCPGGLCKLETVGK